MMRLLGISGSLRAGSFNTHLLRNAAELVPPGVSARCTAFRSMMRMRRLPTACLRRWSI
ncbi:MAG: hypothetical protein J7498_01475 [Sphingobium sp.]|nr:hypothetical protein [Sphingobium sp.]